MAARPSAWDTDNGNGGPLGELWRWACRAAEVPGEHSLPDTLKRARAASGRADAESLWALRQYEALRYTLEQEKRSLATVFAASTLSFWALALLVEREPRSRNLWTMLSVSGGLTLGVGLRIAMVNGLLRHFWERANDE